ncbi:deubiquitinase OTUD6B [Clupea harengus]|uniref:ubiquitinyl hydrolase 1 n=1 Tax=Clupea harengus TaxID=7950 RepID=A0A6P3W7G9_CLUHA|nr:deubiquitinase OTUD6B [Clupea harengus]
MEDAENHEELLAKQHRKEKKDLQGQIQSMKNAVPKNDKKRRKQLLEDITRLEAELSQKHEEELRQLANSPVTAEVEQVVNGIESIGLDKEEQNDGKQSRSSKAQKRREKKVAMEKEREARIAEAEVENLQGSRHQEGLKLRQKLAERRLQIREIQSDGHCMYRAIDDQLATRGQGVGLKELRTQTAKYMRCHADDFLPFLTNTNTGDMFTADEFEKYCSDVEDTAAWGGQLELRALTEALQLPIEIFQADAPLITIGDEHKKPPVVLVYMRHAFGLGEHYNSVEALKELANEEEG